MYTPVAGTWRLPVEFLPHGRQATYLPQVPATLPVQFLPVISTPNCILQQILQIMTLMTTII